MADSTIAAEAATAGITIGLAGSLYGMDLAAIAAGFLGGLVARTFVEASLIPGETAIRRYMRGFLELCASGLTAGLLTPLAEPLIGMATGGKVSASGLHMAAAGVLGMVAPVVVPMLRRLTSAFTPKG